MPGNRASRQKAGYVGLIRIMSTVPPALQVEESPAAHLFS